MIGMFSPLLSRIGYGMSWRSGVAMTWGGLRGAVGLTLGLMVARHPDIADDALIKDKVRHAYKPV